MSEAAHSSNGYSLIHGFTRNPHDLNRNSGGSSAGTGAGIASGMAPCGLGTDTMGSCRIPAMCCGGTGMRPSIGRYSKEGILPCIDDLDTPGPLGVTVADLALLDSVLSGQPKAMPRENLKGVTFGSPSDWMPENIEKENKEAVELAIKAAQKLGGTLNNSAFKKDIGDNITWYTHCATYDAVNEYLSRRAPELNMTCDDLKEKSQNMKNAFMWKNNMEGKSPEEIEERNQKIADDKASHE